ncbi:hypothetical protein J5N97_021172 [Dioscorea zingiberensis]|uniref:TMEM205-like domain-containing protein n=1 Tax=Dioscorea zingiberensis TaxID=325984 RepID=A0A9D5CH66_9LILI|nr:hypothetical protein J5N97_021172 [Dioscorea zingiberensis]
MINVLALSLVAVTLAGAGIWSPPPDHQHPHPVREGRRVIVVEYERQLDNEDSSSSSPLIQEAKEKYREASSLLPNLGQGLSSPPAGEKASQIQDHTSEKAEHAKQALESAVHTAKEKMENTKESMESAAKSAVHKAKEKVEDTKESMENTLKNIAGNAKEKVESGVKGIAGKVKEKAEEAREAMKSDQVKNVGDNYDKERIKKGEEVKKDLEEIGRRMKRLMYNVGWYVGVPEMVKTAVGVVHLMGFAVAYGSGVWVTFVSSYLLARTLPRQQFGVVQSKVYPVYFQVVGWSVGVVIVAHLVGRGWRMVGERMQVYYLLAVMGFVLVNMFVLEPKATKIMFERMKLEKEEGRGRDMADIVLEPVVTASPATTTTARTSPGMTRMAPGTADDVVKSRVVYLNKQLKKLNTYSSLLNVLTLMGLTFHLVYLARSLQLTC